MQGTINGYGERCGNADLCTVIPDLELKLSTRALPSGRLSKLFERWSPSNRYVTFFYGVVNPRRHTLTYVNAGHNAPIVVRSDGSTEDLAGTGSPIGLLNNAQYGVESIKLQVGDIVICYSDGAVDGPDPGTDDFGEDRLVQTACKLRDLAPPDIVHGIVNEIDKYHGERPHMDDITVVALKRVR